jgi:L-aminopeptidase/D-esterase-like protein
MPAGFGPIPGLKIGHAQDPAALTGCTVFVVAESAEDGMVAACEVRGGAVGERELAVLDPAHIARRIHGLAFAGGSAFGLDAAVGVMRWLEERGIGFDTGIPRPGRTGTIRVPIVPGAILFDLGFSVAARSAPGGAGQDNDAKTTVRTQHPGAEMGYAAAHASAECPVAEGSVGAGAGATVGKLFGAGRAMKAGIGCWTEEVQIAAGGTERIRVAALAAVNAFGDVRDPETGRIIAGTRTASAPGAGAGGTGTHEAPVEVDSFAYELVDTARAMQQGIIQENFAGANPAMNPGANTVLVAVATDAALTRVEAKRVAIMSTAGMARALSPAHTSFDGDIVFVLSLGRTGANVNAVGSAAADAVARAIVRGVTQAHSAGGLPGLAGQ